MQIKESKQGEVLILTISEHLDSATATVFESRLLGLVPGELPAARGAAGASDFAAGRCACASTAPKNPAGRNSVRLPLA